MSAPPVSARRPGRSILPITGVAKTYAWGAPGILAGFLGRAVGPEPVAEWWLGTHPDGAATVDADGTLGSRVGKLPWMLKVLAIGAPLSLQAHPDETRARAGLADEQARGIPKDERRFRDPNAKPELLVAIEPTRALAGIRPAAETLAIVAGFGLPALETMFAPLRTDADGGPGRTFAALLGMPREAAGALVAEAVARAAAIPPDAPASTRRAAELVRQLAEDHPADPAVLAALLLHDLDLAPGEAVFIAARTPHAYLGGFGLELMASSDNVIRGGLSRKPTDAAAFLATIDPTPGPAPRLPAEALAGMTGRRWHPAGVGFELVQLTVTSEAPAVEIPIAGPAVVLGLEGVVTVRATADELLVGRGAAAVLLGGMPVRATGDGRIAIAGAIADPTA